MHIMIYLHGLNSYNDSNEGSNQHIEYLNVWCLKNVYTIKKNVYNVSKSSKYLILCKQMTSKSRHIPVHQQIQGYPAGDLSIVRVLPSSPFSVECGNKERQDTWNKGTQGQHNGEWDGNGDHNDGGGDGDWDENIIIMTDMTAFPAVNNKLQNDLLKEINSHFNVQMPSYQYMNFQINNPVAFLSAYWDFLTREIAF